MHLEAVNKLNSQANFVSPINPLNKLRQLKLEILFLQRQPLIKAVLDHASNSGLSRTLIWLSF